ncbi:MAG: GNAT family N-acetyltransferase [Proteobacteria bacterium]|nr:GNAT family N-acetyltransferase [Pseudomonadota bacterium]
MSIGHDASAEKGQFAVELLRPDDAPSLVELFRAVYGNHYPIQLFYDPEAIVQANRDGRYYSIVARTPSGQIVGASHLYRSSPFPGLYEAGVGLVSKDYRNTGINKKLLSFLYESFVPGIPHIQEVFGEAVCNHPYMQKSAQSFKHTETAIELALMPAAAYSKEKSASGRVAVLVMFRCYHSAPHRIFIPRVYEDELRWIYARLDDDRELCLSEGKHPEDIETQTDMEIFDFAGVVRIAVTRSGADLQTCVETLESKAREKKAVVFQVWVNLTEPWVGESVDTLRRMGYFFGGALPRWFDGDGLLMQKLECLPDFESIVLDTDAARRILSFIQTDRDRVG